MGINGLCAFLRKISPGIETEVPISSFAGHKVAIDASIYFYKFVCIDNKLGGQWLDSFMSLIIWLCRNKIQPVFIFDGVAPPQKERTRKKRRDNRKIIAEKVEELEFLMDKLEEIELNEPLPAVIETRITTILKEDITCCSRKEIKIKINTLFKKENSKAINIGPYHYQTLQGLLTTLGLPWFKATGEAEKTCAWLCKWEYVKAVVSSDSDVLAYGPAIFCNGLKMNSATCKLIYYENALDAVDMTEPQFKDFCIMCGNDYNDRVPGYGPVKSYKLLTEYKSLEKISEFLDTSELYYDESRGLFTLPGPEESHLTIQDAGEEFYIPPVRPVNKGSLYMILFENTSNLTVKQLAEAVDTLYKARFQVE